jgi:hypothetical protein
MLSDVQVNEAITNAILNGKARTFKVNGLNVVTTTTPQGTELARVSFPISVFSSIDVDSQKELLLTKVRCISTYLVMEGLITPGSQVLAVTQP